MSTPYSVRDAKNTLQKLQDVKTSGLANGEVLVYNSTTKLWENNTAGGGGTEIVATENLRSLNAGTPTGTGNILLGQNAASANPTVDGLVCIGSNALPVASSNTEHTVIIGKDAGLNSIRTKRNVLIGSEVCKEIRSSSSNDTEDAVVIGYSASGNGRGGGTIGNSVIIGSEANNTGTSLRSVIIGRYTAVSTLAIDQVIIGANAKSQFGIQNGDNKNVVIGNYAGERHAGSSNVFIGESAGRGSVNFNSPRATVVGQNAGRNGCKDSLTCLGNSSGFNNVGVNCTYIGTRAGFDGGNYNNTIVLTAQTGGLNPTQADSCFIKPIRNATNPNRLLYNSTNGEITYEPAIATQFALDANLTNPVAFFTNWYTPTGTLQTNLGTPITVASGVFAFPAVGVYKIELTVAVDDITGGTVRILSTDDNFTTQDIIAQVFAYDNGGSGIDCANTVSTIVNITDIANDKIRIGPFGVNGTIRGGTADVRTTILFIKLS